MSVKFKSRKIHKLLLLVVILAISAIFTVYTEIISDFVRNALKLCALSVVPSLFPFMVLSALAAKAAAHLTDSTSPIAAIVLSFLLGALCGFPVGAATVASMYKNGALKKDLAEDLCALCNNTGPAFVIGVIGTDFWRSTELGIMFYICQLLSAAFVFAICRISFSSHKFSSFSANAKPRRNVSNSFSANVANQFPDIFCTSVGDSAISVLKICGYIVFFKVLCDTLGFFLPQTRTWKFIFTGITSFLEFTTGAAASANLGTAVGIALCGFAIGFSGLSVMAQSFGILSKAGLCIRPLFKMKLFVGLFSSIFSVTAYRLFDFPKSAAIIQYDRTSPIMLAISAGIILFSIVLRIIFAKPSGLFGE